MRKIVFSVLAILAFVSCNDRFEGLQVNPNEPQTAPPINVLHGIIRDSWEAPWSDASYSSQYWVVGLGGKDYTYYSLGRYTMNYDQIRNIEQMVKEVNSRSNPDELAPYLAIAKFYEAFYYVRMTERLGDIPMSEAMGSEEGNFSPKYDSQKDVYINCLRMLDEANDEMAKCVGKNMMGADLYYDGNLEKWQKAINSFRLRVLMSLSKRTSEINVVEQFNAIVGNPSKYPIMSSNADNMQIVYPGTNIDQYPLYNAKNAERTPIGETYLEILRRTEDPRTFVQLTPGAGVNIGVEGRERMFSSYLGANSGDGQAAFDTGLDNGQYALNKFDLYLTPSGVPTVQLGYPEIQFIMAEAVNRGWTTGSAATHYGQGITADMQFYNISQAEIDTFLAKNAYEGDNATGLTQILEQKYVAFFQNSGWQPFLEQRRTGVPVFDIGPANMNNGKIPVRWMYPINEVNYNEDNLKAALQAQFGGSDDINDKMWLIK